MVNENYSTLRKSLIKGLLVGALSVVYLFGGEYVNRVPSRDLEAKSVSSYQKEREIFIEKELKRLVAQKEKELLEKSRMSKDTTMVRFVSLKNKEIKIENSFQEYIETKKTKHLDDHLLENVISYTQPESRVVKEILNQLNIPSKNLEKDAQKIIDFTHKGFVYLEERDSYPKSPLETVVEGGGDCEDLAILSASLMKGAGMDVVYIALPGKKDVPNMRTHLMVGVNGNFKGKFVEKDNKKYYIAESAGSYSILNKKQIGNWKIGKTYPPLERRLDSAIIYSIGEDSIEDKQKLSSIQ